MRVMTSEKTELITNNTSQDIVMPIDLSPEYVAYHLIVGRDVDNSPTMVLFGFTHGVDDVIIFGEASPAAGKPISNPNACILPSSYRPFVRVIGGTLGDKIEFMISGVYLDAAYELGIFRP